MKNQTKGYNRIAVNIPDDKPLTPKNLIIFWRSVRGNIKTRLDDFSATWKSGSEEDIFAELAFCLFTPQSKAVSCGAAVKKLSEKGLLFGGTNCQIAKEINIVRFRNNKAKYLVEAREKFYENGKLKIKEKLGNFPDILKLRSWLVSNIKGLGYKEASHFLRNVGFGKDIAILDRHILRNLKNLGIIGEIPKTISEKTYLVIEDKMKIFSRKVKIPLDHMDLLFWCKETGEIYK